MSKISRTEITLAALMAFGFATAVLSLLTWFYGMVWGHGFAVYNINSIGEGWVETGVWAALIPGYAWGAIWVARGRARER